jgi:hypothetical protein
MPNESKIASRIPGNDSIVRTFNTVSTVPNAKNPFVKPASGNGSIAEPTTRPRQAEQ